MSIQNYFDTIIIGSGPAGISAGIYLARAGKKTLILAKDKGALKDVSIVENYFGVSSGSGTDLINTGIESFLRFNGELKKTEVLSISTDDRITVATATGDFCSNSLILATGRARKKPRIKGLDEFTGKGVSYCAVCDGFFYKNSSVAVLGSGSFSLHEAKALLDFTKDVTILTNGSKLESFWSDGIPPTGSPHNFGVNVISKKIKELKGEKFLQKVVFEDGQTLDIAGLFVAAGTAGGNDFAVRLGLNTGNQGEILIDSKGRTNIKNIYAAGDCTGGLLQIAKAVGEGAIAANSILEDMKSS